MTQLIEDITIRITLNHCEGDSVVLGGPEDLRTHITEIIGWLLGPWLQGRHTKMVSRPHKGIFIEYENTGLYEAPEVGGGDN
jgi:hypothetical protein